MFTFSYTTHPPNIFAFTGSCSLYTPTPPNIFPLSSSSLPTYTYPLELILRFSFSLTLPHYLLSTSSTTLVPLLSLSHFFTSHLVPFLFTISLIYISPYFAFHIHFSLSLSSHIPTHSFSPLLLIFFTHTQHYLTYISTSPIFQLSLITFPFKFSFQHYIYHPHQCCLFILHLLHLVTWSVTAHDWSCRHSHQWVCPSGRQVLCGKLAIRLDWLLDHQGVAITPCRLAAKQKVKNVMSKRLPRMLQVKYCPTIPSCITWSGLTLTQNLWTTSWVYPGPQPLWTRGLGWKPGCLPWM
jgi:hypothetical protein